MLVSCPPVPRLVSFELFTDSDLPASIRIPSKSNRRSSLLGDDLGSVDSLDCTLFVLYRIPVYLFFFSVGQSSPPDVFFVISRPLFFSPRIWLDSWETKENEGLRTESGLPIVTCSEETAPELRGEGEEFERGSSGLLSHALGSVGSGFSSLSRSSVILLVLPHPFFLCHERSVSFFVRHEIPHSDASFFTRLFSLTPP